jgi:hypothetical protein
MQWIREQGAILRRHPIIAGIAAVWAVISFYDTACSQLLPASWAQSRPTVYQVVVMTTGWLSLQTWLAIGALICAAATVVSRSKTEQPLPAPYAGSPNQTVATPWLLVAGCAVIAVLLIGVDLGKYLFVPNGRAKISDSVKPLAPSIPSLALCTDGPCAPVHLKQGPEYVKEIGLGVGSERPLVLQATSLVTADRLRVAVDYSEYRSGWMPKTRAFIGEIKEPVKGKTERLQLIYVAAKANGGTDNLWWGDPTQNHAVTASTLNGSPLPAIVVKGRVAIIGSDGEQHYYFILIRGVENIGTYVGIIPQYDLGDWIESWEAD